VSVDEIVCRDFAELATEYLDGAIPDETLELVEEHLAMCDWCRDYLSQIETTATAAADAPGPPPPDETLQALVGAFRGRAKGDPGG
jgi:predicted anti-sigma-YlaC factor YlaD